MSNSNDNCPESKTSSGENPMATTLFSLLSLGQIQKINELSSKLEINTDEISLKLFNLHRDELSRSGADDVIEHLKALAGVEDKPAKILEFKKPPPAEREKKPSSVLPDRPTNSRKNAIGISEDGEYIWITGQLWELQYMSFKNAPVYEGRLENDWWKESKFLSDGIDKGYVEIVPEKGFIITEKGRDLLRKNKLHLSRHNLEEFSDER